MKKIYVGIDIGSISVKATVATADKIDRFCCRRVHGRPIETSLDVLKEIEKTYDGTIHAIVATGSGAKAFSLAANAQHINEFQATSLAVRFLYPEARTVFEIGGQTSKYILLDNVGIVDYGINGDCAAGTGSFIDQQAARLHYNVEELGQILSTADKTAKIAGRCSVFAKSDMIHAQQMGYEPPEILKGLCLAVARNYNATIVKGRRVKKPALFIGGVALNTGVYECLREILGLTKEELIVPKNPGFLGSVGCALFAKRVEKGESTKPAETTYSPSHTDSYQSPLTTKDVVFLRDIVKTAPTDGDKKIDVYLGIDVGSVSTNLVLMNETGELLHDIYTKTKARPIEVVTESLKDIASLFKNKINILGVGTTGSGRELIGELVGADVIKDEITAHKTGALHISRTMTNTLCDTIFEIGGQDSKYIRIENGVVVDFTMNEACAAGTGSFLEEQAEKLGINIKDEFAELALKSKNPIKMGERCTVFMERDVSSYQMKGAKVSDIVAGLSYSVVLNYLNRVVRGRNIGNTIFFQGGTAYNDAVAAAFAIVLGKKIIVPPHNGVIGAVGAALLAQEANLNLTKFKGFDISAVDYKIREFTCKACTNECDVQEFTVDGSKTYWGDKCSSRYRKKAYSSNKPVLRDLFRERNNLVLEGYLEQKTERTIGIPRAMYFHDRFPFWQTYFSDLGFGVIISAETNKKIAADGIAARAAEPCHPIGVAHGHIKNLLDKGVDYIWLPNILTAEPNGQEHVKPYLCPWGMTLPFMAASSPQFEPQKDKFLSPTLHHMHGTEFLSHQYYKVVKSLGITKARHNKAFQKAIKVQEVFREKLATLGEMALHKLDEVGRNAVVLLGRPYNLYDFNVNLNVPTKIRNSYGVDVIPMDILPLPATDIRDVAGQMFWNYGKKILSVAKHFKNRENLHFIYITNFKCGPDSFIKHFTKNASEKPFLTLQFDEHSNDAGTMTRVEAYLDSKGLLKTIENPKSAPGVGKNSHGEIKKEDHHACR